MAKPTELVRFVDCKRVAHTVGVIKNDSGGVEEEASATHDVREWGEPGRSRLTAGMMEIVSDDWVSETRHVETKLVPSPRERPQIHCREPFVPRTTTREYASEISILNQFKW
jgi:hypothetical protein